MVQGLPRSQPALQYTLYAHSDKDHKGSLKGHLAGVWVASRIYILWLRFNAKGPHDEVLGFGILVTQVRI